MKSSFYFFAISVFLFCSCAEPKVRRPKQHSTTSFYKEVIDQNKKLNALEKQKIENLLSKDTLNIYYSSPNGFWYTYNQKDSTNVNKSPVSGDLITISFDIKDITNNVLYENRTVDYKVDKEDFIPALQEGVKLMKEGEKVTFVIPSYRAFGVTGDGNKIGINQTIKSTLTLQKIKEE